MCLSIINLFFSDRLIISPFHGDFIVPFYAPQERKGEILDDQKLIRIPEQFYEDRCGGDGITPKRRFQHFRRTDDISRSGSSH